MSNIRDLQKLKGGRPAQPLSHLPHRIINPELYQHNNEPLSMQIGHHKIFKNTQYAKQSIKQTPSKILHKRGVSFGTPESTDRQTLNLLHNPRLSMQLQPESSYNFPLKLDLPISGRQHHIQQPKTQRKIKNNYVISKEHIPQKKDSLFIMTNHHYQAQQTTKNNFNLLMAIGKGGFGKVWKVQHKRNKQVYAMKLMSKAKVISKKSVSSVMNERNFLARLSHPFLVNMINAFQDRQHLYVIMDYLDGGDLRYHLGNRQFFNQKETKFFIANIIIALEYLHRHRIIHRDLKPENLVFESDGYLRLTDLGVSRELRDDNHQDTSGTPGYMSPEVMMRKSHSYPVDYFALGVIAYELMLGKRPYMGANRKEIRQQILAKQVSIKLDQLPYKWSPYSIDFINRLILRNPEQRLGANGIEQIKEHPWLADIEWQKLLNKKVKAPFKPISIEDDYENYKEQISEDTINDNEDQIALMLRKSETQELFEGYQFERNAVTINSKKSMSYPTNHTDK